MKLDPSLLSKARVNVISLPMYDAGISVDTFSVKNSTLIHNLSVNENPSGMSPHAMDALQAAIKSGATYPDSDCVNLREKLAEKLNVTKERIIVGNGSEDILSLICKVFINAGDNVLIPKPTFSLHHIYAAMMGAEIIEVPIDSSLGFNASGWLERIALIKQLKILMLSNPSNPVGCILTHAELSAIVNACPLDTLVVIDEAYIEYAAHETDFPRVFDILENQQRPWIVLRTFSKAYGLAGMRVGYGICSNHTFVNLLSRVKTPYNVNRLAQVAAIHALDDQQHLDQTIQFTLSAREHMRNEILSWGIQVAPSSSNFLFIDTKRQSIEAMQFLMQKNVLIKAWREKNYSSFIRVSIGQESQNDIFVRQLKSFLFGSGMRV
ncbi:MAG: histidinol-phosphate transaminase [Cellvibrio sp.]